MKCKYKWNVNVNGVHNSTHGINLQVSRGLRHLAEQGILHRDIALRNILLTNNDVVKVRHDDGDDHDDHDHHLLQHQHLISYPFSPDPRRENQH